MNLMRIIAQAIPKLRLTSASSAEPRLPLFVLQYQIYEDYSIWLFSILLRLKNVCSRVVHSSAITPEVTSTL